MTDMMNERGMAWRLGLDLGTNSLGWIALQLEGGKPAGIMAIGSRIISSSESAGRDPQSKQSLAVNRRDKRAMRRRRDRFKRRQAALLRYLVKDGLFPADQAARQALETRDPYELRARALDERLEPGEIARALFHLNQRRGFKSNRKTDRTGDKDDESGKVAFGIAGLKDKIAAAEEAAGAEPGSWTFGKFLYERRAAADDLNALPPTRARAHAAPPENKNDVYDFYPSRDIIEAEFEAIWEAQAAHHPDLLTDDVRHRLYEIIFYQRPLKAPKIGLCTLVNGETRLAKAHPLFQQRRLLEEINALQLIRTGEAPRRLMPDERDRILMKFQGKPSLTFVALRKELKLDSTVRFNKESENRPKLLGDEMAARMGDKKRFGTHWRHLSVDQQWEVIQRRQNLESDADEAAFVAWLAERYSLTSEQAAAVASVELPMGFGRIGLTATTKLIEALTNGRTEGGEVLVYSEAVDTAGLGHHSDRSSDTRYSDAKGQPILPYYGLPLEHHLLPGTGDPSDPEDMRVGRLTNPTVHIGLNQLARVVNALIRRFGRPTEIALELARDLKLSDEEKQRRNKENNRNRIEAEKRSIKLREIGKPDTGENRARLKLWEELGEDCLDRRCVYTGERIGIEKLFSDAVEIDHILPFSITLDDSNANKIVCMRDANRRKGNRSPHDAWGHGEDWPDIAARASRLPANKRWRFDPDALARFTEERDFQPRQLVDTQYLGRLAREYLTSLYPERGQGSSKVWVSPGQMTELVRRKLGLNPMLGDDNILGSVNQPKNRLDHRHHSIDAFVVAVIDRAMLAEIARISGETGRDGTEKIRIPDPWPNFRDELHAALRGIVVSHRPDHGTASKKGLKPGHDQTAGRLHNDTAYGFTGATDAKGKPIVVRRIALTDLKSTADLNAIRDPHLRQALRDHTAHQDGKAFEERIKAFPPFTLKKVYGGIRHVRVTEALSVIPIRDASGRAYKAYKGDSNYRYDVWEMPDGKWITRWQAADGTERSSIVSMFDAHQPGEQDRPHPAARKVISVHQNDLLAIEPPGEARRLGRVVKFGQDGRLYLADPKEGGALKARDADKEDAFRYDSLFPAKQKLWKARQVRIDELGRVLDPGFPARKSVRRTRPRAAPVD